MFSLANLAKSSKFFIRNTTKTLPLICKYKRCQVTYNDIE
jgi:hypothetical protein